MSFSENLQAIRKKYQLSQEELAEMLGVSRQAVSYVLQYSVKCKRNLFRTIEE